jgi:hypothetical protein
MTASGTDINIPNWRYPSKFRDEFHYAYIPISGNCDIIVKVDSVTSTDPQAKAGVMIRDSLSDNSAYAMMCITPGSGAWFQYRYTAGGIAFTDTNSVPRAPYWLWLRREWLDLPPTYPYEWTARCSLTGAGGDWDELYTSAPVFSMTDPVYIGLSLTARNATATCTAVFSNVSITTDMGYGTWPARGNPVTLPWPWPNADIGIKSNTAAPLYVTLQDSNTPARTATVIHDDPNAVLKHTWQEWLIPLIRFSDVNLAAIKKITIGVGNRIAQQGVGTLYVDDIGLYIPGCMCSRPKAVADLTGNDCMVDFRDYAILTNNWLSTQNPAIDMDESGTVDYADLQILTDMWLDEILWPPPVTNIWAYEFKNDANCYDPGPPIDANDLHLEFNGAVYLIDTGPFTSFTGNGTNKITLSAGVVPANDRTIIRVGSTGTERTLGDWWWTANRARISKEMVGVGLSCKKTN